MEKKFKVFLEKYKLGEQKSLILAISGGPDSIVLLDLAIKYLPKSILVIAHANHGLRIEARWDENFVSALAAEYEIPFVSEKLKLKSNSEGEAREARYNFLNKVRLDFSAQYILCGHHLNDQAETVLLSMIRGSGPLATWGMAEQEGPILRPLLSLSKKDIMAYTKLHHLRYHLDRTNYDVSYARNRVRAKLIPQFLKINPRFIETIGRNAELGREMEGAWEEIITQKQKKIYINGCLEVAKLTKEPIFVQKELIKRALEDNTKRPNGFSQANIEGVLDLLSLKPGKKTEIGTLVITKGTKKLSFGNKAALKVPTPIKLELDKALHFGGFILKMTNNSGRATKNNILLPASIGYNLNIRTWRDGDRIKTKAGTKKLSDLFTDAKIGLRERKIWPVVVSGRKILWVPKLAACEEAVNESKQKLIKIEVRIERKK